MERRISGGKGSYLAMVAIAVVSTSVILISYRLHRRLEADLRVRILGGDGAADQQDRCPRRPRGTKKKKKVRFADDVAEPSSNSEEYRRWARSSSTAASARLA